MFNFEHREYLMLLLVIPVLILVYAVYLVRRRKYIRKIGDPRIIEGLMPDYSAFRSHLKFILMLLSLTLVILAIAGPRFGSKLTQVKHEGIDIIIALDVSNSMLAEDIKPNRLERAKQELSRLLDKLENDRVGLIVFAGNAYTQVPVTNDYLSAKMFVSNISTQMVSRQGTAIGEAIELAIRSFNPQSKAGKAIVIISDGENHEGDVKAASEKAIEKGIRIYTIGMGLSQGVRIPESSNNMYVKDYKRDRNGNFVITRLNEEMLKEIAENGNGRYYRASSPEIGLNSIMAELNRLNREGSETTEYTEYEHQFPALIWMALFLLILEFLLLDRKNKWLKNLRMFDRFITVK